MQTQSVFVAGNSLVVAIPKHLAKDLNIKSGQKVVVDKAPDGNILIKKTTKERQETEVKTALTPEFKEWLDNFMEEYKPILKKLAKL